MPAQDPRGPDGSGLIVGSNMRYGGNWRGMEKRFPGVTVGSEKPQKGRTDVPVRREPCKTWRFHDFRIQVSSVVLANPATEAHSERFRLHSRPWL
jgi:hypothetical protein